MAEEVKDASKYVPIAIAWGFVGNGFVAIILLITFLFAMPSVEDALNDASGFPFIYVFRQAVSTHGVNALTSLILLPVIASNILFNASTARQTFAFAHDGGLPFGTWISAVHPTRKIPVNAIGLSCLISVVLSLINIGSSTAFNAIISLNVAALMFTYAISIGCVLHRRLTDPESLPPARWSLGRMSVFVNATALVYVLLALFWSFWPGSPKVDLDTFNWSVVIFGAVAVLSVVMYFFKGRNQYEGPVVRMMQSGRGEQFWWRT